MRPSCVSVHGIDCGPAAGTIPAATSPERASQSSRVIREIAEGEYRSEDGRRARRETGLAPGGNPLGGSWVLRDASGEFLDFDRYRHDLFERNGLRDCY